jgi:hypothetical protein
MFENKEHLQSAFVAMAVFKLSIPVVQDNNKSKWTTKKLVDNQYTWLYTAYLLCSGKQRHLDN